MKQRLLILGGLAVSLALTTLSDHLGWFWVGLLLLGVVSARCGVVIPDPARSRGEKPAKDDAAAGRIESPAEPREATWDAAGLQRQMLAGLLLVLAGFVLLGLETGRWSLEEIRSLAAASPAGERKATTAAITPARWSLASAVLVTVGLVALGRFPPFPGARREPLRSQETGADLHTRTPDQPGTIDLVSQVVVTAALWRVAARTLVLVEPRSETLLISLAVLGWVTVLLRLCTQTSDEAADDEPSRVLLARPLTDGIAAIWLTAVAVGSWEAAHPSAALTTQSLLPSAWTALILAGLGDLLAWGVLNLVQAGPRPFSRAAVVAHGIGAAAWLGFPLGPGFWGRMWLLTACLSCTHTAPLTGVPEFHAGFQLLSLVLLMGWLTSTSVGLGRLLPAGAGGAPLAAPLRWRSWLAVASALLLVLLGLCPRPLLVWLCALQGAL
jgi:hypothetical protein